MLATLAATGCLATGLLVGLYRRARRASAARSGVDDLMEAQPTRADWMTAIKEAPLGPWTAIYGARRRD